MLAHFLIAHCLPHCVDASQYKLPVPAELDWSHAELRLSVVVTSIPKVPLGFSGRNRASLMHHGWLHGARVRQDEYNITTFPLIGVVNAWGMIHEWASNDPDLVVPVSVGDLTHLRLRPFEQHSHKMIDIPGTERYQMQLDSEIASLELAGMSREDAEGIAQALLADTSDYKRGKSDTGWVHLATDSASEGAAWVVCVDLVR
jgi:hypothetical protein